MKKSKGESVFLNKTELARHLCCSGVTLDKFIARGTVPPPHSRPGPKSALWVRRHFEVYVMTGRWPDEAFTGPAGR